MHVPGALLRRLLPFLTLALWLQPVAGTAAPLDLAIRSGHFYAEAGGQPGLGFTIADGSSGTFWTSYQALGGVDALGYPASAPYQRDGFTYQATQGALLQWRPDQGRAVLANTFEQLSTAGFDDRLYRERQIPYPVLDDQSGGDYARAVTVRLDWLTDPGIAARYYANPNPSTFPTWSANDAIQLYGLPMSRPEDFGTFVSQRFQRITFQRWLHAVPGMPAPGSVVRVLGGDLAKEMGLVPAWAQQPGAAPAGATDVGASPSSPGSPGSPGGTGTGDAGTGEFDPRATIGFSPAPPPAPPTTAQVVPDGAPLDYFSLAPCRAYATDPRADQSAPGKASSEAGTYRMYGATAVKIEHNDNCWSPSQLARMGNHRDLSDITEVVVHWTALDYQRSAFALRRGVSVNYLVPLQPSVGEPPLEMVDPRNAAWHAGPINKRLWIDDAHRICQSGVPCVPNGNVHSIGFENEGSAIPNGYQVGVMTDILAGLIRQGYPIQLDRLHIVGHRDVDKHKIDPGDLDLDQLIAVVRQKLSQPAAAASPAPAAPSPMPTTADGSAASPFPFTGSASGQLTGDPGGRYVFYTLPASAGTVTLSFAYQGMAAPPGSVGVTVYEETPSLGTASPAGNHPEGAQVTVTPRDAAPLLIEVYSYIPQTVSYTLSRT